MLTGCSTSKADRETLDLSINLYNKMLRMHEMEKAIIFVAEQHINDFISRKEAAKNVRIVDYRLMFTKYDELKKEAEVRVEMDYYHSADLRIRTVVDMQKWAFIKESGKAEWKLMSLLPVF
jgi:hypothetical protein